MSAAHLRAVYACVYVCVRMCVSVCVCVRVCDSTRVCVWVRGGNDVGSMCSSATTNSVCRLGGIRSRLEVYISVNKKMVFGHV